MSTENLRAHPKLTWLDVPEPSYERFLLTSYKNHIRSYSKHNSIFLAEARAKVAPPEIRKGPRDIWKFIYLDGVEAGYLWLVLNKDGKSAFLMDIHLYPKFRGKGHGAHVMATLRDYLISMNVENLELNVLRENAPAVRLYEKVGFVAGDADGTSVKMRWLLKV